MHSIRSLRQMAVMNEQKSEKILRSMLLFDISLYGFQKYLFQQSMVNQLPLVKIKVGLVSEPVHSKIKISQTVSISLGKFSRMFLDFSLLSLSFLLSMLDGLFSHRQGKKKSSKKQKIFLSMLR